MFDFCHVSIFVKSYNCFRDNQHGRCSICHMSLYVICRPDKLDSVFIGGDPSHCWHLHLFYLASYVSWFLQGKALFIFWSQFTRVLIWNTLGSFVSWQCFLVNTKLPKLQFNSRIHVGKRVEDKWHRFCVASYINVSISPLMWDNP